MDSLNHIQAPLKKMPKMFNLGDFKKGYCPYTWLNSQRLHYKGGMMSKSWFNYDRMDKGEQAEFDKTFDIKVGTKVVVKDEVCWDEEGHI